MGGYSNQFNAENGASPLQTTDMADEYINSTLQYPVFVKPVSGSQGSGVRKVYDEPELATLFESYTNERVKVALVEEALEMPDYRLLMFDGEMVNAYERQPFSVIGDGEKDVQGLIEEKIALYEKQGRNIQFEERRTLITQYIGRSGLQLSSIPEAQQKVRLLDVSNLSMGGDPVDISEEIHPHWIEIGNKIARGFNLRICGVDLACADITSEASDYSVLEVNATPGTKQFVASGEPGKEKLDALFMRFFRTSQQ